MSLDMGNAGPADAERRQYHTVRRVFTDACELIAPLIVQGFSDSGYSRYALVQMVRARYPELTDEELQVLVTAAMRLREDGNLRQAVGS